MKSIGEMILAIPFLMGSLWLCGLLIGLIHPIFNSGFSFGEGLWPK